MRPLRIRSCRSQTLTTAFFVVTLLLAACGAQGGASADGEQAAGDGTDGSETGMTVGEQPAGSAEGSRDEGGPGGEPPNAAPIEQRIIKTGDVTLEVDNVASVLAQVRGMADALGGYVGGSQAGTLEESATVTLRVPAERFDELIARLHELEGVEVVGETTSEQDVTRQIVDLEARIRNLQASEATYRALVERAERIEEILSVQSRLDEVRGQIEQLEGQLQTVAGQADLSTLTVLIVPRGEPVASVQAGWDPKAELDSALAALVGFGQGVLNVLIWLAVVWLPLLSVLAGVGVLVWRVAIEVRRRWPGAVPPQEAEPMR